MNCINNNLCNIINNDNYKMKQTKNYFKKKFNHERLLFWFI